MTESVAMQKILFVCTGNSCRSVMAQGLLQHRLKQLQHRLRAPVEVSSAGIFAIDGMSPSRETLRLLQHEGVDLSAHMARNLSNEMIREAAQVFVMETFQRDEIIRRVPEAKDKVHLLKAFGRPEGDSGDDPGIADPIGKPREIYEVCFNQIKDSVERVAQSLIADHS
jgi:protein-tyrosine-phosphatase